VLFTPLEDAAECWIARPISIPGEADPPRPLAHRHRPAGQPGRGRADRRRRPGPEVALLTRRRVREVRPSQGALSQSGEFCNSSDGQLGRPDTPEYISPGAYIEEIGTGLVLIEGVGTSTAGFVGQTERGPTTPHMITGWPDYQAWFVGPIDTSLSYLPWAVRGFFDNGGRRAYVARRGRAMC
jgi:hypothetical protein